ncbi:SDR family oxidoreductase [Streptomyces sp. WELS2]|uniref:SDR family oxidoreductase n=1 Tax=Streptomyces sp. WELS2 TaxID=2749435 RepID=UPI0015F122B3|nr:SDR family oxidoreductase [Streptomyces sp. WELS2]
MENKPLSGKSAVVVGGSRGIGRAIVQRLAADGAGVVFSYLRNDEAARETERLVRSGGGTAWAVKADSGDLGALQALFREADKQFSEAGLEGLDILVNSAAIPIMTPIGTTTEADYDRVMDVNAKGPFFAMQYASARMNQGGRIVNVSSVTTRWPRVPEAGYIASKSALEAFTRVGARELAPRQITVNTVSPGPSETEMLIGSTTEEIRRQVIADTPLSRLGRPAEIAAVVAFLAGPDGAWVTGQNIRADGGLVY